MPKVSISLPPKNIKQVTKLKEFFGEESTSSILALSVEVLNWIIDHNEEYRIIAQNINTQEIINLPLVKLKNK